MNSTPELKTAHVLRCVLCRSHFLSIPSAPCPSYSAAALLDNKEDALSVLDGERPHKMSKGSPLEGGREASPGASGRPPRESGKRCTCTCLHRHHTLQDHASTLSGHSTALKPQRLHSFPPPFCLPPCSPQPPFTWGRRRCREAGGAGSAPAPHQHLHLHAAKL